MKSWKKTKREHRRHKERNLVLIKLELSKEFKAKLIAHSQRENISVNKLIDLALKSAMDEERRKLNESRSTEDSN